MQLKMSAFSLGYITCPSVHVAQALSYRLLETGLIACANILPGITSIYRYQGKLQSETEVLLLLKTTAVQQDAIMQLVAAHHPYQLPCVTFMPIQDGLPGFLAWVQESCAETK
jgi:periplasmic divalent cation tolerance protein